MSAETSSAEATAPEADAQRRIYLDHQEALIDESLKESFPASDPPSITRPSCLEVEPGR